MFDSICSDLRRYIGQPVNIYTEDGHIFYGTVIHVYEDSVRIIEKNEYILLLPFRHIVAVQEPKMCCRRIHKECCGYENCGGCREEFRNREFFEDRCDYRRDRRDCDCDYCRETFQDFDRGCCC